MAHRNRLLSVAVLALTAALTMTACSSSAGKSATSSSASGSGGGANLAAAQAVVTQYSAAPTRFPVDKPLIKKLGSGQTLAFLQCAAPFCALLTQLYKLGTSTMGIPSVKVVQASSTSAADIQSALSSIQSLKPAVLLLPAVNLGVVGTSLSNLHSAGTQIVGAGVMGGPAQGIDAPVNGPNNFKLHGKILADWAAVTAGAHANIVFYGNPEFDFTNVITEAFKAELAKNCASCAIRFVNIPASTIGSTAPSRVVSDLQAHPNTQVAIFGSLETATGLPAAFKVANIHVKIAGSVPIPANLQDMKSGGITAAVGLDAAVLAFTQLDAAVRLATHEPLTAAEANGDIPSQLITGKDLPADVSNGFSAYPDLVQRFKTLWANAGPSN